tara:strand:- start:5531 stop:6388 length:858 start_codon:yes stop_codon:yes gene_type:complete
MFKYSITKKQVYALVLESKKITYKPRQKNYSVKKIISKKELLYTYDSSLEKIIRTNFHLNSDLKILMESYLQIIFNKSKYPYIFGHLAQTLDGYIATESGESRYISSIDNLEHLHMLRAISDVVLVGSNTVKFDNPKLTTRLVKGPNPMRVVIDKNDTIKNSCNLLKNKDRKGFKIVSDKLKPNDENIFLLPLKKDEFRITDIISLLKSLGNKIIFIEGGGNIISHFYRKKFLNRLHLCISPILIGRGINSFIIDKDVKINEAKIKKISYIKMGKDILCNIKLPS